MTEVAAQVKLSLQRYSQLSEDIRAISENSYEIAGRKPFKDFPSPTSYCNLTWSKKNAGEKKAS